MTITPIYLGCDVSKDHLDFFDPSTSKPARIENNPAAIDAFLEQYRHQGAFVVYEATGCYDRPLAHGLARAGLPSHRANPAYARRFGQATGRKAKTDPLDARMLSGLGTRLTPPADPLPRENREYLTALHRRRDQLVEARKAERTRLAAETGDTIITSLEDHIAFLDRQIAAMDEQIEEAIERDQTMKHDAALLRSAPGVGPVVTTTLLALMPEMGTLSPKRAASLAGLAPFNHDSGKLRGKRCISGGRRHVRRALYMAALTASRSSARFRAFHDRLIERGAPKKVALIAVARKLLTALNAMLRDQKQFT